MKREEILVQGPEAVLEAIVTPLSHPDLFSVGRPGKRDSFDFMGQDSPFFGPGLCNFINDKNSFRGKNF